MDKLFIITLILLLIIVPIFIGIFLGIDVFAYNFTDQTNNLTDSFPHNQTLIPTKPLICSLADVLAGTYNIMIPEYKCYSA